MKIHEFVLRCYLRNIYSSKYWSKIYLPVETKINETDYKIAALFENKIYTEIFYGTSITCKFNMYNTDHLYVLNIS